MSNACNDAAYLNSILMRNRFRILNNPPPRYNNLAENPYPQFSKSQLDMRRKVQILEYNAAKTNTKTNNLTRSERWAQLVAGKTQQRNLPYSYINANLIPEQPNYVQTCPSGTILYTPTSASGVPGPIMNLYYDPNVPLYMYNTNTNASAVVNQPEGYTQFVYDNGLEQKDNYLNQNNSIVVTSIYINNILTPTYNFKIQFPVSFFIQATVKPGVSGAYREKINLNFNSNIELQPYRPFQSYVYYGDSAVEGALRNPNNIYSPDLFQSVTFDISMNVNSSDPNKNSFYGNQYIGNYKVFNLILETQKGYVYDICLNPIDLYGNRLLNYVFEENSQFYNYFENFSYGICANVDYATANTFVNCKAVDANGIPLVDNKPNYASNFYLSVN